MRDKEAIFHQYLPMIRKRAHAACRRYSCVEYEDMEAQGFLIFCKALETHDSAKGAFSTHLWNSLRALWDYGASQYNYRRRSRSYDVFEEGSFYAPLPESLFEYMSRYTLSEFTQRLSLMEASVLLSRDAHAMLMYIISFHWYLPEKRNRLTLAVLKQYWGSVGWTGIKVHQVWKEIKEWWGLFSPSMV